MALVGGDESIAVKVSTSANTKGIDETSDSLERMSGKSQGGESSFLKLTAAVAAGQAVFAGIKKTVELTAGAIGAGFSFNSSVEQAQATINAFTKDASKTAEILDFVKKESVKTQFSFVDMANAASGLIPASKMSGVALKDLIKEAEILAALNPSEGLVGAAFSLKEALSGDFVSIVERFNLPRKRLNELKAQGVPAMQAIQTALREMGIDYDLVTKQGETTAARWDTIKDQFNQMAGAMAKPIFDRVSKALGDFAKNVDLEAWGKRGARAVETLFLGIKALGAAFQGEGVTSNGFVGTMERLGVAARATSDFIMNLYNSAVIIGQYMSSALSPAFSQLWNTIETNLLPALQRFWNIIEPAIVPILKVLGAIIVGVLIVALNMLANTLDATIKIFTFFLNLFSDGINRAKWFAATTVDAFNWTKNTISSVWAGMKDVLTSPVNQAKDSIKAVLDQIEWWIGNVTRKVDSFKNTAGDLATGLKNKIPGFATGTNYTPGGMAIVGERGPELISMPRGASITPADKTAKMRGSGVTFNNTFNVYNKIDVDSVFKEQGWRLQTL